MKTRIIGAVVALVLAVVGAFVLINYVQGADARAAEGAELVDVYIVDELIPRGAAGESIEEFVRVDSVPERTVAEGNVTNLADLNGLVTEADLLPGEQLLEDRFIDPAALAAQGEVPVPAGMQEATFTLTVDRVVGGAVVPGSRVGVVMTYAPPAGDGAAGDSQARFALNGVLVTKVQAGTSITTGEDENESTTANQLMVTVALSTHDIEKWAWAAEGNAGVWLTLQNEATDVGGSSPASGSNIYE
ncbi:Flp pilus assembly protein CpaB [Agromyces bauzanensis]|uniref:Flp pilus assembly protein RcpC/CpaB domain-containing protein n=1 Tax=Agromyces bauzanensis TaxID=1308924 RepID=A0A917PP88_9MICO|nr:RcpC/CpaB family pilus assembly protein [Agromyces bauzanensis]GGJ86006.1 hypothetical protein GCM10011372_25430 [Agromyces bauzanensis]